MGTIKINKSLQNFLNKEGVLKRFEENVKKQAFNIKREKEEIEDISEAFNWSTSEEGHTFWSGIYRKYMDYVGCVKSKEIAYYETLDENIAPIIEDIKSQPETEEMGNVILVLSQQIKGDDAKRGIIAGGKILDISYMIFKQMQNDDEFADLILTTADFYRRNN